MDVYFEQNVENPKIDARKKKHKILTILRYILLVAAIIVGYLMVINVMLTPYNNPTSIVISVVISILAVAPFILSFIFIGKYLNNSNLEFDYVLTDGLFRIIKVVNRKKRKKLIEFNISSIESIGKLLCDTYDRYSGAKDIKKVYALCDYENEDRVAYVYFSKDGTRYLLHIEPNDEMIMSLKRSVSRISIIDKSMKISSISSAGSVNTTLEQNKGENK